MAYIKSIAIAAVLLLALSANAQDSSTTTIKPATPAAKINCANAESIAFQPAEMAGIWYEVAIYPAPSPPMACTTVNIAAIANSTDVAVHLTYASDMKQLWVNQTAMATVPLVDPSKPSKDGYNVTLSLNNSSWPTRTYKLLFTDNKSYAIACAYTNATDLSTEIGVILSRERMLNATVIGGYGAMASNYTSFLSTSMSATTQTKECMGRNGASTTLPFLSALMAAIYALYMLIN